MFKHLLTDMVIGVGCRVEIGMATRQNANREQYHLQRNSLRGLFQDFKYCLGFVCPALSFFLKKGLNQEKKEDFGLATVSARIWGFPLLMLPHFGFKDWPAKEEMVTASLLLRLQSQGAVNVSCIK